MVARTLLIVDDNSNVRSALQVYLARHGWSAVVTASDATRGLTLAEETHPAAIVLDNSMPDVDGLDVLADLRQRCPDATIVMHTSDDTIDLRERASRLGADAVVPKGVPLDELAATLSVPHQRNDSET